MEFRQIQALSDEALYATLVHLTSGRTETVRTMLTWEFLMKILWYTRGLDIITSGGQVWISSPRGPLYEQVCVSERQAQRVLGELLVWRLQGMTSV